MLLNYYGKEYCEHPGLSWIARLYIWIFGIPISGLRIRLRRVLPNIRGDYSRILDVGCGKGIFTFELARKFSKASVVAIDIDRDLVDANNRIAERSGFDRIEFREEDLLKMTYRDTFDLAVSIDNLEHVADDRNAVERLLNSLRPGGTFVCHVPAKERTWIFWGRSRNFDVPGHVRTGYSCDELQALLTGEGFQIETLMSTYGYLETVTNNLSYLITGAAEKRKPLYALVFPFLNALAWLGRHQDPGPNGAGVLAIARKPEGPRAQ